MVMLTGEELDPLAGSTSDCDTHWNLLHSSLFIEIIKSY